MTTTDTDALTERLWEAVAEVRDQHPRVFNDAPTDDVIPAVLPIVAAEVRKAQADAWDEGQISADKDWTIGGHVRSNPYRAAHYPEPFTWTEAEDARRLQSIADGAADHYPEQEDQP